VADQSSCELVDAVGYIVAQVAGALRAEEQGGFHRQECTLCRDWLRRDVLDSLGRRPFFGDGPVASRDIHDVSAL